MAPAAALAAARIELPGHESGDEFLRLRPHVHETDGFFAAVMERRCGRTGAVDERRDGSVIAEGLGRSARSVGALADRHDCRCLLLAWAADRAVARRTPPAPGSRRAEVGLGGLRRVVFPLAGLVLVLIARPILQRFVNVALLDLAVPLLGSARHHPRRGLPAARRVRHEQPDRGVRTRDRARRSGACRAAHPRRPAGGRATRSTRITFPIGKARDVALATSAGASSMAFTIAGRAVDRRS